MYACQCTLAKLEEHVRCARIAADNDLIETAEKLRDASVDILETFIAELPTGGMPMYGKARAEIPTELIDRLVKTYGSLEVAEEWYNRPNSVLHGETPAELVHRQGKGWLLDATCNWGLMAMKVIPE